MWHWVPYSCAPLDSISSNVFLLDLNYGKRFNYHWYCEHILQNKNA